MVFMDTASASERLPFPAMIAASDAGFARQDIACGVIAASDVRADLGDLCRASHQGRPPEHQITMFKSVGTAVADLVATALVLERGEVHPVVGGDRSWV